MSNPAETVRSKGPCEVCGSEKGLVTYEDGHQYCFSGCQKLIRPAQDNSDMTSSTDEEPSFGNMEDAEAIPFTTDHMSGGLKSRGIALKTLSKFGYFIHKEKGSATQVCNFYDQQGRLAYQKHRGANKKFFFERIQAEAPKPPSCQLWGQHVWGERMDKRVIVTEGELDAMTVAQALNFKTAAVVSIVQGVNSAEASLKANYRWLDRFEEIIFWFDDDEPGQSVVETCAQLFEVGKVKNIRHTGFKDASDMAQEGKSGDIYGAVFAAEGWSPEGIINASQCISDMDKPPAVVVCDYPFPILQKETRGMLEGDVTYHVSGTGSGKTTLITQYMHTLRLAGIKFGVIRFEDTRQKAQLDLMSMQVGQRLHMEDIGAEKRRALHTEVFGAGLVELYDPETAEWTKEAVLGYIRFMVKALGCRVVFIDPLSFLVALSNEKDERKALDQIATDFARLAKQMSCNIQVSHHLNRPDGAPHEEGTPVSMNHLRGSGALAMFSMQIFSYERNQQGDRPDLMRVRVLKNRFTGWTGVADTLKWDENNGHYSNTDEPYPDSDPSPKAGFGVISDEDYT